MTDLAEFLEFLLARIGDDEAAAMLAKEGDGKWDAWTIRDPQPWSLGELAPWPTSAQLVEMMHEDRHGAAYAIHAEAYGTQDFVWTDDLHPIAAGPPDIRVASLEHCARHDPARVLAECEAKRRIIDKHRHMDDVAEVEYESEHMEDGWQSEAKADALEYAMRCLALPYADHADYRDEWRP